MSAVDGAALGLQVITQFVVWTAVIRRRHGSWGWWALSVGLTCVAVAHAIARSGPETLASWSDIGDGFSVVGYCWLTAGFLGLARRSSASGLRIARTALLTELVAVTSAIGVLATALPTIPGLGTGSVDRATVVTYAASDLLLGIVLGQVALAHPRNRSIRIAVAAMACSFMGDIAFLAEFDPAVSQTFYLMTYPLVMAAFWHPDMVRVSTEASRQHDETTTVWLLGPAALALLGVMAISVASDHSVSRTTLVLSTVTVGSVLVRIAILVRQVRVATRRLTDIANIDELTGLVNRRRLLDRMHDVVVDPAAPIALLFIDLDRFKTLNDDYGHALGDEVLVTTGARLAATMRTDDIVARYAGDEFVVVAHGVPAADHPDLCRRVAAAIAEPIATGHGTFVISASIGVVAVAEGSTVDQLLDAADRLMYETKSSTPHRRVERIPTQPAEI